MTYGGEMWTLRVLLVYRLKVAKRDMERAIMLGVFLRDRFRNEVIQQRTKVRS